MAKRFLCNLACICFIATPLIVLISTRATPLTIALVVLLLGISRILDTKEKGLSLGWNKVSLDSLRCLTKQQKAALILCCFFFISTFLSIFMSDFKGVSLKRFIEFCFIGGLGISLIVLLPQALQKRDLGIFLIVSIVVASAVSYELLTDVEWRKYFKEGIDIYILNRPVLTLLFWSIPVLPILPLFIKDTKHKMLWKGLYCLNFVILIVLFCVTDSEAAQLGALTAVLAYLSIYYLKRFAYLFAVFILVFSFIAGPNTGKLIDLMFTEQIYDALDNAHARERVNIWKSFGKLTYERPILGAGFNVSHMAPKTSIAQNLLTKEEIDNISVHPHNGILQIWYELGIFGACFALFGAFFYLWYIRNFFIARVQYAAFAFLAAFVAVSISAHGLWQSWWVITFFAGLAWFRSLNRIICYENQ